MYAASEEREVDLDDIIRPSVEGILVYIIGNQPAREHRFVVSGEEDLAVRTDRAVEYKFVLYLSYFLVSGQRIDLNDQEKVLQCHNHVQCGDLFPAEREARPGRQFLIILQALMCRRGDILEPPIIMRRNRLPPGVSFKRVFGLRDRHRGPGAGEEGEKKTYHQNLFHRENVALSLCLFIRSHQPSNLLIRAGCILLSESAITFVVISEELRAEMPRDLQFAIFT